MRNRNQFLEVLTVFQKIQRTASEKEKANIIREKKTPIKVNVKQKFFID